MDAVRGYHDVLTEATSVVAGQTKEGGDVAQVVVTSPTRMAVAAVDHGFHGYPISLGDPGYSMSYLDYGS